MEIVLLLSILAADVAILVLLVRLGRQLRSLEPGGPGPAVTLGLSHGPITEQEPRP